MNDDGLQLAALSFPDSVGFAVDKSRLVVLFVAMTGLLVPSSSWAAGFAVADQGPASTGIANASTARFDLAEGAFYNPAGYLFDLGGQVGLGTAVIFPSLTHTAPSSGISTGAQTDASAIPSLHAGYTFESPRISIVGYTGIPFGSGVAWDEDWIGRFEVTQLSLRVLESGVNVGYMLPLDGAAIGISAGPRLLFSDVELRRKVDAVDTEGSVRIVGDGMAVSGQMSVAAVIGPIQAGVSYRPRATIDYEGQADFEDIPIELANRAKDQNVSTSVTLPDRIAAGVAGNLFGLWVLSLDVEVFLWSTFESFAIDFESEDTPDVSQPRNWSNTVAVRWGNELDFDLMGVVFRTGFAWDPTPGSAEYLSPSSPDSNRLIVTAGVGWRSDFGLDVDAGYAHVFLADQASTGEAFPGEYSGSADVLNVGASFRF